MSSSLCLCCKFFFFNVTATTEIYTDGHTLSLHYALPISFASMGDAFAAIGDDEAEVLTINAAVTFGGTWLSARIGRFQLRYPDLAVRLSMSNDYVDFDASNVDVEIGRANV